MTDRHLELRKWSQRAKDGSVEFTESYCEVADDLAALLKSMKPKVNRVLEAGCGSGLMSALLAARGFTVDLLDFSLEMLQKAREVWDGYSDKCTRQPAFYCADLSETNLQTLGVDAYDCVFNVGLLEHYEEDEIVELLRAMSSLSRNFVIAMVPNSRCAVYRWWRWRQLHSGSWPYGREIPRATLSHLMAQAGLKTLFEVPVGHLAAMEMAKDLGGATDLLPWLAGDELPVELSCYLICSVGRKLESGKFSQVDSDPRELLIRSQRAWIESLHLEQGRLSAARQQESLSKAAFEKQISELQAHCDVVVPELRSRLHELETTLQHREETLRLQGEALVHQSSDLRAMVSDVQRERELRIQSQVEYEKEGELRRKADERMRAAIAGQQKTEADLAVVSEKLQREMRAALAAARAESEAIASQAHQGQAALENELEKARLSRQGLLEENAELNEKLLAREQCSAQSEKALRSINLSLESQLHQLQQNLDIASDTLSKKTSETDSLREQLRAITQQYFRIEQESKSLENRLGHELSKAGQYLYEVNLKLTRIENSRGYRGLQRLKRWRDALLFLSATHQLRPTISDLLEALLCWPWRVVLPPRIRTVLDARNTDPEFYHHSLRVFTKDTAPWQKRSYETVDTNAPPRRKVMISLIATTYNEEDNARKWIRSIASQTRQPDELIIVDAGSADSTVEIIQEEARKLACRLEIVVEPGCNIAQGRNIALGKASFDFVAVTDAGCELRSNWMESIVAPFEHDEAVDAVIGWSELHLESSAFAKRNSWLFVPQLETVDPKAILPSSRSFAFRKSLGLLLGGYPAHLTKWAEDTLFCLNLTGIGARWAFAPDAVVCWYGPASWPKFLRLRRNYQLGNGEARIYQGSAGIAVREILTLVALLGLTTVFALGSLVHFSLLYPGVCSALLGLWYLYNSNQTKCVLKFRSWKASHHSFFGPLVKGWLTCIADTAGMLEGLWRSRGVVLRRLLDPNAETVVFLRSHEWFWMKQRLVQLAEGFARRGYQVVFCPNNNIQQIHGEMWKVKDRIILCNNVSSLRRLKNPVIYSAAASHCTSGLTNWSKENHLIFDLIDEVEATGSKDEEVVVALQNAQLVIAASRNLVDYLHSKGAKDPVFLPNAVDCEVWRRRGLPPPDDMKEIVASGEPIIGYAGALGYWFDFALLEAAAKSRLDWQFVLIGPVCCEKTAEAIVRLPGNVHHLGLKHNSELPGYVEYFSAAVIPFLLFKGTLFSNPIKLFEYAALEVPVVSTDMPECRRHDVVRIARTPEEFAGCLEKAIVDRNNPESRRRLRDLALKNTWDERVQVILGHLDRIRRRSQP